MQVSWSLLGICGIVTACSGAQGVGCTPYQSLSETPSAIRRDGRVAIADINCDSSDDTLSVGWRREGEVDVAVLRVSANASTDSTDLPFEGLPRIIAIADLNGDATLDVFLALMNESTVSAHVVLLGPPKARSAVLDSGVGARSLSFLLDDVGLRECRDRVTPRLRLRPGQPTAIEVYSGESWNGGCVSASSKPFVLIGDTLRVLSETGTDSR
jgi:hypothetical protein